MANLVENASLYAGGVSRVVVERTPLAAGNGASALSPSPSIRVIVEDKGPGIAASEREHLFERFYRGSRSGQRTANQGTGLGLSLVAEHVRLHGGSVWIEDAPGGGARFVVELPLDPEAAAPGFDGGFTSLTGAGTEAGNGNDAGTMASNGAPSPSSRTEKDVETGS